MTKTISVEKNESSSKSSQNKCQVEELKNSNQISIVQNPAPYMPPNELLKRASEAERISKRLRF